MAVGALNLCKAVPMPWADLRSDGFGTSLRVAVPLIIMGIVGPQRRWKKDGKLMALQVDLIFISVSNEVD